MKLYNSLTRQVELFTPINPPHVGLYACGPTVYDYTHLGHLRKYTMDDVLIRTLRHADFQVTHVQNVTDVGHLSSEADTGEDKLEKGARKYQLSVKELALKFEKFFYDSMDAMGNLRPNVSCRATAHIQEMLDLVKTLEENNYTYEIEGDGIYFDTSKFEDYGQLSPLDLEQVKEGARVEKVKGKRNPTDFAVWKFERPGENRAMSWSSPWAEKSFPGWHIECSAMSMKYLGNQFDIHTGGVDHLTIHHPNEIAQAEAATGKKPFVKYWVHHEFLQIDGEKMSKSKNNFYTIEDIRERGFSPMALRLLFLQSHYRSQLNFTWESLAAIEKSWQKLKEMIASWKQQELDEKSKLSQKAHDLRKKFFDYIEDDLKTAESVAVMWAVVKSDLPAAEKYQLLLEFDQVFALGLAKIGSEASRFVDRQFLSDEVSELLQERQEARAEKDWDTADALRDKIEELGFEIGDVAGEQKLKKLSTS